MDAPRQRIVDALTSLGLSMNEVSRQIGKNSAYLHQFIYRGSPKALPEAPRLKLAKLLMLEEANLTPDDVNGLKKAPSPKPINPAGGPRDVMVYPQRRAYDLPMSAREAVQVATRPANGMGLRGVFGILIETEDMLARYRPGDVAIFAPNQPLSVLDACYVEDVDHRAYIGLVRAFNRGDGESEPETVSLSKSLIDGSEEFCVPRSAAIILAREIAIYRR